MKKVLPFLACVLLVGISCNKQSTELTDEQKAAIISEVENQFIKGISELNTLDILSQPFSDDNFISAISNYSYYSNVNEFRDSIAYYFSLRESQEVHIVNKSTTVLSSDLALLTGKTNWDVSFKSGEHMIFDRVLVTQLWKKEENGWKIICLHETY